MSLPCVLRVEGRAVCQRRPIDKYHSPSPGEWCTKFWVAVIPGRLTRSETRCVQCVFAGCVDHSQSHAAQNSGGHEGLVVGGRDRNVVRHCSVFGCDSIEIRCMCTKVVCSHCKCRFRNESVWFCGIKKQKADQPRWVHMYVQEIPFIVRNLVIFQMTGDLMCTKTPNLSKQKIPTKRLVQLNERLCRLAKTRSPLRLTTVWLRVRVPLALAFHCRNMRWNCRQRVYLMTGAVRSWRTCWKNTNGESQRNQFHTMWNRTPRSALTSWCVQQVPLWDVHFMDSASTSPREWRRSKLKTSTRFTIYHRRKNLFTCCFQSAWKFSCWRGFVEMTAAVSQDQQTTITPTAPFRRSQS